MDMGTDIKNNLSQSILISCVIPFHNSNKYLSQTLQSLNDQGSLIEVLIIVDHGSVYPSINHTYENLEISIYFNTAKNNGAGYIRSQGFNRAAGRWVIFLDPDDMLIRSTIKDRIEFMMQNNLAFCFGEYYNFSAPDRYKEITPRGPFSLNGFLAKKFTVGCLTVMLDKEKISFLPENSFVKRNDYALWIHVIKACRESNYKWGCIPKLTAIHRLHRGSLTAGKFDAAKWYWKFLRCHVNGYFHCIYYFIFYMINTIRSRLL